MAASQFTGEVVGVLEGDIIKIMDSRRAPHKIRLYGIDCPETNQTQGPQAKQFSSDKVLGQHVRVEVVSHDHAGREVAIIYGRGFCLNADLLKAGLAWVRPQSYKEQGQDWPVLQSSAKAAQRGVWSDPSPIPPWKFKETH